MGEWAYPVGTLGVLLLIFGAVAIVARLVGGNHWGWHVLLPLEVLGALLLVPAVIDFATTFSGCNSYSC